MKCICPKCKFEFYQNSNKEAMIKFIKENPGCSISDIHWDIRIAVKNVYINLIKLEEEGIVELKRRNGKNSGKVEVYLK